MNPGTLPGFLVHFELQLHVACKYPFFSFWNILYYRYKKTSDNRKFIVERHDFRSLSVKYLRAVEAYREEGDQLCMQMKPVYTVHI